MIVIAEQEHQDFSSPFVPRYVWVLRMCFRFPPLCFKLRSTHCDAAPHITVFWWGWQWIVRLTVFFFVHLRAKIDDSTCVPLTKNDLAELAVNAMLYPASESNSFETRGLINGRKLFNRCQCTGNSHFRRHLRNCWAGSLLSFFFEGDWIHRSVRIVSDCQIFAPLKFRVVLGSGI